MKIDNLRPALALALILWASSAAYAAAPSPDDPLDDRSNRRLDRMEKVVRDLRTIVFQGKDTGQPVVVQPAETADQINSLNTRITDLEQTLIKANAQTELLVHALDQSRQDLARSKAETQALADRIGALDIRLTAAEKANGELNQAFYGPPPPPATGSDAVSDTTVTPATDAFNQAYALLQTGDTSKALEAFKAFVDSYGDTPKGPEARYWLGETLFLSKAYPDAASAYIGAIRGWPNTTWAPDATLKLARTLVAIGKPKDACRTLDELNRRYPKAPAPLPARAAVTRTQAQCSR